MSVEFIQLQSLLLIFVRIAAAIAANPVFSRRNVPNQIRVALILLLTVFISGLVNPLLNPPTDAMFLLLMFKELLIGFTLGSVVMFFQMMLFFVGDILDFQFGLSMAKIFDPGSSIQVSAIGNYFQIIFIVILFATNGHLLMIKAILSTFRYLPLDTFVSLSLLAGLMADLFLNVLTLMIKLAAPFVIAQFVLEISMGILMKLIPQIHVFVINIQLKIMVGLALLLLLVNPVSKVIDSSIVLMIESIQQVILQSIS